MGNGIYLGAIRGIKLYLHWTFLLLIGWFVIVTFQANGNINHTIYTVAHIGALFACVVLHELGHALTARRFGIRTRDITLLPIGGVARMEKMPEKPGQEFLVAVAGPAVNIVIAASLFAAHRILAIPILVDSSSLRIDGQSFLTHLMFVNVIMAAFNLIPAFPMDGGRILRAALSQSFSRQRATQIAVRIGQVCAVLFMIVGLFHNFSLLLIGVFVFFGAKSEGQEEVIRSSLTPYHLRDVTMTDFPTLPEHESLDFAVLLSLKSQTKEFLVQNTRGRIVGILTPAEMLAGLSAGGQSARIADVMRKDFKILSPDLTVMDALRILGETNAQMLPVGKAGNITGIIDLANIFEFLEVRRAITAQGTGGLR